MFTPRNEYGKIWKRKGGKAIEKYLKRFADTDLDMACILLNHKQYAWRNHQSDNINFYPGNLIHTTERGINMRSLSERDIGDIMDDYYIPFRYEFALEVDVTALANADGTISIKGAYYRNGRFYKVYYPDFVILLADGSIIIWEHLGRPDSATYREDNAEKMMAYLSSGIVDMDHLIFTFPEDVKNSKRIHQIIHKKILPYI